MSLGDWFLTICKMKVNCLPLKMKAPQSSGMIGTTHPMIQYHIPWDLNHQDHVRFQNESETIKVKSASGLHLHCQSWRSASWENMFSINELLCANVREHVILTCYWKYEKWWHTMPLISQNWKLMLKLKIDWGTSSCGVYYVYRNIMARVANAWNWMTVALLHT